MKRSARELATTYWNWESPDGFTDAQISTGCLVDIGNTLRRIERLMLSLGSDGLHMLIQDAAKAARSREKARRAKRRGKAKK